jgi:hypothetical protein
MRKLALALAALGALGIALPGVALADTVIIHKHRDHPLPPPPVVFHHHDNNKTVIIKHHDDD